MNTAHAEQEANRLAVQASFERWARGAGSPFELLMPQADWTIEGSSPLSKTYHGVQAFLDAVIHPFNARLRAPLVPRVRGLYADADTVVTLFDASATAIHNTFTWYFVMRGGRVNSATAFFDTREFDAFWSRVTPP